ncbi:MAG: cation:proton antiporter [Nitrospinota bacterium]|nr:cation:proton antiporter [Nitrospinota bacterium]
MSQQIFVSTISLVIVALAARQVSTVFVKLKLPLITGFLFVGILSGPFVLNFINISSVQSLRFIDQVALAFIAFAAGAELHLKELKPKLNSVKWTTIGIVVATFSLGSVSFFMLAKFIPFVQGISLEGRIAISILCGSILVARSPSSAIAIIKELRAKGPFVQTALGVTVVMDSVVIVLFAINSSIADALLTNVGMNFGFIALLVTELSISILIGYCVARTLGVIASFKINIRYKIFLMLFVGYLVFYFSDIISHKTLRHFSFELFLEPLLICMIAGLWVTNRSQYKDEFSRMLNEVGPAVYLLFFTLIGASLKLSTLVSVWPIALALFVIRIAAIFVGSFTGGMIAGDPIRYSRVSWMAYITQAGIGMGLATKVSVEFPGWGQEFATLMIGIIVLNQIVGPSFFKTVIRLLKEAFPLPKKTEIGVVHTAIIFGEDGQAQTLARHLRLHHWEVKMATFSEKKLNSFTESGVVLHRIREMSSRELRFMGAGGAGAIVCMLSDEENLKVCKIANEEFELAHLVVRLNERSYYDEFKSLGASIVSPSTAMISLLDHFVRSPSAVSLLLGMEENQDILDLEVRNPNLFGLRINELHLPNDVLVVSVHRDGKGINVQDNVFLEKGDVYTIAGNEKILEELSIRFETDSDDYHSGGTVAPAVEMDM